jgi:segregation and condensation protein A
MEPLSVRERMSRIMEMLEARSGTEAFLPFQALFTEEEGRRGVVVSFIALMELTREQLVDLVQNEPMGPIYVKNAGSTA